MIQREWDGRIFTNRFVIFFLALMFVHSFTGETAVAMNIDDGDDVDNHVTVTNTVIDSVIDSGVVTVCCLDMCYRASNFVVSWLMNDHAAAQQNAQDLRLNANVIRDICEPMIAQLPFADD